MLCFLEKKREKIGGKKKQKKKNGTAKVKKGGRSPTSDALGANGDRRGGRVKRKRTGQVSKRLTGFLRNDLRNTLRQSGVKKSQKEHETTKRGLFRLAEKEKERGLINILGTIIETGAKRNEYREKHVATNVSGVVSGARGWSEVPVHADDSHSRLDSDEIPRQYISRSGPSQ